MSEDNAVAVLHAECAAARAQVAHLEARIVSLQIALEREIHRTRTCTEAGIKAGLLEGMKQTRAVRKAVLKR